MVIFSGLHYSNTELSSVSFIYFLFYLFILFFYFFVHFGTLVHVFQVSGYTSSEPSTTASASMTTSTTGNFDFLSPLTLVGRISTGGGIKQGTNVDHKTLLRQIVYRDPASILRNNLGNVTVPHGVICVGRQEKMNSAGIVSVETGNSDNSSLLPLQYQFYTITSGGTVQPTISKNPSQSLSIDIGGVKGGNPSQFVGILNINAGITGVPMIVGTSAESFLTDNIASDENSSVIPPNFPVLVTHQPILPNVLYQSQVLSPKFLVKE